LTNSSLLEVTGSTLNLRGSWTNAEGVITATGSTTNLGGTFTMTQFGTFNREGGVVNLTGVVDNRENTVALNAATGSWNLIGATIRGGTLVTTDGAQFVGTKTPSTLEGVAINGELGLADGTRLQWQTGEIPSGAEVTVSGPGTVTISGSWTNNGTFNVTDGGTIDLAGSWVNTGIISETSSTLNLGGTFKTSTLGSVSGSGGIINFTGTLTNDGELTLHGAAINPRYQLRGGTIIGGVINTVDGAELATTPSGGTLDAVTLAGTLRIADLFFNSFVNVSNGLTLDDGTVSLDGNGAFNFLGSQTLDGSGNVQLLGGDATKGLFATTAGTVLTIGAGISIHGTSATIGRASGGAVTVHGEIASNSGGTITVYNSTNYGAGTLTGGVWKAEANSILRIVGADIVTNAATLVLDGSASRLYSGDAEERCVACDTRIEQRGNHQH
jgi:hypothetical protein